MGFFVFPYVFPPPPAAETLAEGEATTVAARGTFIHADKNDPIHYGKGRVTVYDDLVFLEPDFEVGPGPAFHVYLVPREKVRRSSDVEGTMFVDSASCARLRAARNTPSRPGVDLKKFPSVVIWCAQFDVLISPADLAFGS